MWSRGQSVRLIFSLLAWTRVQHLHVYVEPSSFSMSSVLERPRPTRRIWIKSPKSPLVDKEIDSIAAEGRNATPVSASIGSGFAAPWVYQVWHLLMCNFVPYWRSPSYLMAKLMLNIVGGLFIGFTFFKRSNSLEGTQNKNLFVSSNGRAGA